MKHVFSHGSQIETVRRAAQAAWEHYAVRFEKYDPQLQWIDDLSARFGFSVGGKKLKGKIDIGPARIHVAMDVPFVFNLFKKRAVAIVEKEIRQWIAQVEGQMS